MDFLGVDTPLSRDGWLYVSWVRLWNLPSLGGGLAMGTKVLSAVVVWNQQLLPEGSMEWAGQWATWICPSPKPLYLYKEIGSFTRIRIWE